MTSSKIILVFGPIQVILAVVSFQYLNDSQDALLAISIWLMLAMSFGLYYGAAAGIWFVEMLPDITCRNSAFGISYNAGTLWGGMATLIATFVQSDFGGIGAVGWTLFVFGCISMGNDLIASRFLRSSKNVV